LRSPAMRSSRRKVSLRPVRVRGERRLIIARRS
jgi:hypothetical protein